MTHGISFLSHMDEIVVMTNGVISEYGAYQELLSHNGPFAEFIHSYLTQASSDLEDEGEAGLYLYSGERYSDKHRLMFTLFDNHLSGSGPTFLKLLKKS